MSFAEAISKVSQLSSSTGSINAQVTRLRAAGENLVSAYNNELQARNQKAKELKAQRSQGSVTSGGRDMLGTIFALQAGLSLLTGATSDATSGFLKVTNAISSVASVATTAAFAGQGLKGLAKQGSNLQVVLGKVGIAGAILAGGIQIYKEIIKYQNSNNKALQEASVSLGKVKEAADGAFLSLGQLSPKEQEQRRRRASEIVEDARGNEKITPRRTIITVPGVRMPPVDGLDINTPAGFGGLGDELKNSLIDAITEADAAGVWTTNLKKELDGLFKSDKLLTEQEAQNFANRLTDKAKESFKVNEILISLNLKPTEGLGKELIQGTETEFEDKLKNEGNFGQLRQSLGAIYEDDESVNRALLKIRKDLFTQERNLSEQAAKTKVDNQTSLQNTIKAIQKEKAERQLIANLTDKQYANEYNASLQIASIRADLTLSETERSNRIAEIENGLENQNALLKDQVSLVGEINKLIGDAKIFGTEEQRDTFEYLARQQAERISALTGEERQAALNAVQDPEKVLKQIFKNGSGLENNQGAANKFAEIILKIINYQDQLTESTGREADKRNANLRLIQAQNIVQEKNNRLLEKAQGYVQAQANQYTQIARRLQNQSSILDAQKELDLAQFRSSNRLTSTRAVQQEEERIIQEYFKLQLQNETKQAIAQAKADFIRNAKVEENIKSLFSNTDATDRNTEAIKAMPEEFLKILPQFAGSEGSQDLSTLRNTKLSSDLIGYVKSKEGFNPKAYFDYMQTSIGYGTRAKPGETSITEQEAERRLAEELSASAKRIDDAIKKTGQTFTEAQRNSLISFDYNTGRGASILSGYRGDQAALGNRMLQYTKAGGKELPGLVTRRREEASSFLGTSSTGVNAQQAAQRTMSLTNEQMQRAEGLVSLDNQTKIYEQALEIAKQTGVADENVKSTAENITQYVNAFKEAFESKKVKERINEIQNAANALEKAPKSFSQGILEGIRVLNDGIDSFYENLGKEIPQMFSSNMSQAIQDIVSGTKDIDDAFKSVALNFVTELNNKLISNLTDRLSSLVFGGTSGSGGILKILTGSTGGKVTGGSGSKDDVPAMLMGGEYIINKKSVGKYGEGFLKAINSGSLKGFRDGGLVPKSMQDYELIGQGPFGSNPSAYKSGSYASQTGAGGYFIPGTYGQGAITGRSNLLDFATQSFTSGQQDIIRNLDGFSSISLEPESIRLTNFGRRNSPLAQALRSAKGEAFSAYTQDIKNEEEAKAAQKAQNKALRNAAITAIATAAIGAAATAGAQGFKNTGKLSGIFTGSELKLADGAGSGIFSGGINNLLKGNFRSAFSDQTGTILKAIPVNAQSLPIGRATGGTIPSATGIDTVPAMLSGGEFVMNSAATQNLGVGNLQALNAGASDLPTEEKTEELNDKLLSKLDELIEATGANGGNITINVDSSTGNTQEEKSGNNTEARQALASQIKQAVLKIIQDEKRIGGSLRGNM
jgi:lysozyme